VTLVKNKILFFIQITVLKLKIILLSYQKLSVLSRKIYFDFLYYKG